METPIRGKGTIQRLAWGEPGELPHVEYLHREEGFFCEDEWKFSSQAQGAYIFGCYQAASEFAEELTAKGAKCFAVVVSVADREQARDRRREDSFLTTLASVPDESQERFQEMMKRNRLD